MPKGHIVEESVSFARTVYVEKYLCLLKFRFF